MILKSMARKTSSFGQLSGYMDRKADPRFAHLWNLDLPPGASREEVVRRFEENDRSLRSRKGGNRLYHEILSLKRAQGVPLDRQKEALHDLASKWLAERAPGQLGYARMHVEHGHLHYHIMLSAGDAGRANPARLPRAEFSRMQKDLEAYCVQRFPELGVSPVYGRAPAERPRVPRTKEDALRRRAGVQTDRARLSGMLRESFARARNGRELADALGSFGVAVHSRGENVTFGFNGRRWRLRTLGLEDEYRALARRLDSKEVPMGKDAEKGREVPGGEKKPRGRGVWGGWRGEAQHLAEFGKALLFGADWIKTTPKKPWQRKPIDGKDPADAVREADVERLRARAAELEAELERARRERAEAELRAAESERRQKEFEAWERRRQERERGRDGPDRGP